jgi:hypothetical protein
MGVHVEVVQIIEINAGAYLVRAGLRLAPEWVGGQKQRKDEWEAFHGTKISGGFGLFKVTPNRCDSGIIMDRL